MELGLQSKRVLVTGSTKGIGRAIAESFLKEGARVAINGRNRDKLEHTLSELQKKYSSKQVTGFCGDVLEENDLVSLHGGIQKELGGLDILIPNVGSGKPEHPDKLFLGEWKRLTEINLYSAVAIIHKMLPILKQGHNSNIVLISSITAKERKEAPYAYAAAKNSIMTLTKYLSKDIAKDNIRVNCVLPGNVLFAGGRWEELLRENKKDVIEMIDREVPLKRFAKPDEIADTVVFLASEKSSFTTGSTIVVDGGQLNCL